MLWKFSNKFYRPNIGTIEDRILSLIIHIKVYIIHNVPDKQFFSWSGPCTSRLPTTGLTGHNSNMAAIPQQPDYNVWCNRFNPFSVAFYLQLCSHEGLSWEKDYQETGADNAELPFLSTIMRTNIMMMMTSGGARFRRSSRQTLIWVGRTVGLGAFEKRKISC
jgi:hypothetical protein